VGPALQLINLNSRTEASAIDQKHPVLRIRVPGTRRRRLVSNELATPWKYLGEAMRQGASIRDCLMAWVRGAVEQPTITGRTRLAPDSIQALRFRRIGPSTVRGCARAIDEKPVEEVDYQHGLTTHASQLHCATSTCHDRERA
jgi:hypothetical protein